MDHLRINEFSCRKALFLLFSVLSLNLITCPAMAEETELETAAGQTVMTFWEYLERDGEDFPMHRMGMEIILSVVKMRMASRIYLMYGF